MSKMQKFLFLLAVMAIMTACSSNQAPISNSATFDRLLIATHQDTVNSDFTEGHFPLVDDGTGNLPVEEYGFDRGIKHTEVVAELAKLGLKPVGIKRAMEYIAAYPDAQLDHPIVIIGAQWTGAYGLVRVPIFDRDGSERNLYLLWLDGYWFNASVRFLVVRLPDRQAGE